MNKFLTFLRESYHEVTHEVTWTKFKELRASTTLVLVASLIFAVAVGLVDFGLENALRLFYQSFQ